MPETDEVLLDVRGLKMHFPVKTSMFSTVSYTHLRAHETPEHLVCRLLPEKKKNNNKQTQ